METEIRLIRDAVINGFIECPECGNRIESDCDVCCCGWENTLILWGLI